jgi:DNA-binding YbaB/EbfC family protein
MDLNKLMQQAQQMQKDLGKVQDELNATVYTGENGGSEGVKVEMDGTHKLQSVAIAAELMGEDNREMLQDMILLAVNQASEKADADRESKLGSAAGGMNIPGLD